MGSTFISIRIHSTIIKTHKMEKATEQTPYVFVYGTLMSGYGNNRLLSKHKIIDTGTTKDKYVLKARSIPFLIDKKGEPNVQGEIYKVSENTLQTLDMLEGHPSWYRRKVIDVINEVGDTVKAWVYFMPEAAESLQSTVIPSGNYRDHTDNY